MNSQFSAIIFDCDGVMFDSRQANINFYNHLLSRFHLPPMDDSDVSVVHMKTAKESVRHIFRGSPHEKEAQAYRLAVDYTPFIHDMAMEPGLKELLALLKRRHRLAVATNRSTTIGQVMETFGLAAYFDMVVSSLDVRRPKPHPESLLKILDFLQLPPESAVYIGDSPIDGETARAARVPFIAYKNETLEARYHANCMADIAGIVNGRAADLSSLPAHEGP